MHSKDYEPVSVELAVIVPPAVKRHKVPNLGTLYQIQPNLPIVLGAGPNGRFKHRVGIPHDFGSDVKPHTPKNIKEHLIATPPPIGSHAALETIDAIHQAAAYSISASERARRRARGSIIGQKPARSHGDIWPKSWTGAEKEPFVPTATHVFKKLKNLII